MSLVAKNKLCGRRKILTWLAVLQDYERGSTCEMVSRALWLSLSGKRTSYSTMRSPRRSGRLGYGSPPPEMRRLLPGCTTSVVDTLSVWPSSVGVLTAEPHKACVVKKKRARQEVVSGRMCVGCVSSQPLSKFIPSKRSNYSPGALCRSRFAAWAADLPRRVNKQHQQSFQGLSTVCQLWLLHFVDVS